MNNWTASLLNSDQPLEEAIKVLHSSGNRIAFVIDKRNKLLGTVTDGDIRRALIDHLSIEESKVSDIMNSHPRVTRLGDDRAKIVQMMRDNDLLHIPVLDNEGVLVNVESVHDMLVANTVDNPVFLMAGGFGKRLRPLTLDTPKPLLPILDKPILERIIEQFIEQGFHIFYISVHYKAEQIREYFGDGSDRGISITYVDEEKPLGTAGALGILPNTMPNLPMIVMNGDLLTKINFRKLLEFHLEQGGESTICLKEYDFKVPYGVVSTDSTRVVSIQEKPLHKFFVNAGVYVIDQKTISLVGKSTYLDMPSFLQTRMENGGLISAYPIYEYWLDIGHLDHYKYANDNFINEFNE